MVTQNIGDLGKLMGEALRKGWHPYGNPPHGETDFYPLCPKVFRDWPANLNLKLAKVGKAEVSPWR
jgi:hypothetical protein